MFPLSLWLDPVMLAGAYLQWTKQYNISFKNDLKSGLPEQVGGHPWFKYIDPELQWEDLDDATRVLNEEYQYFVNLVCSSQSSSVVDPN